MSDPASSWLARYQPWHRQAEVGFWVVVLLVQLVFDTSVTWIDANRARLALPLWEPLVWELTSNLATQLVYEYLKDVRSYVLILAAILSYRFLLLRAQGEARLLDPAEPPAGQPPVPPAPSPARPERFLVRKLRKEFLIAAGEIEWLQAQGNYVGLHVNGHDYLLRSTLSDFLEQLDPARFARVHRSYAVNLDRVGEIEPTDGGDARLKMKDGSQVPCSRRYRDGLAGPA